MTNSRDLIEHSMQPPPALVDAWTKQHGCLLWLREEVERLT